MEHIKDLSILNTYNGHSSCRYVTYTFECDCGVTTSDSVELMGGLSRVIHECRGCKKKYERAFNLIIKPKGRSKRTKY